MIDVMGRWAVFVSAILVFISCDLEKQSTTGSIESALDHIDIKMYYYPQKAELMLDSLINTFDSQDLEDYKGQIGFLKGHLNYRKGELDNSLAAIQDAHLVLTKDQNNEWLAKCQLVMGWIAEFSGYWEQAKVNYYEVISLETENQSKEWSLAYLGIGRCKQYLSEDFAAEVKQGVRLLKAYDLSEFRLFARFSETNQLMDGEEKVTSFQALAEDYLLEGMKVQTKACYKQLSIYYSQNKQFDSALNYVNKALELSDNNYNGVSLNPALLQIKGFIYLKQQNPILARKYLEESKQLCEQYKQDFILFYIYNGLYLIEKVSKNYYGAILLQEKAYVVKERYKQKSKERLAIISETTYNNKILASNILQLKSERAFIQLISVSAFLLLLMLAYILFYRFKKKQEQKQELVLGKNNELQKLLVGIGEKRYMEEKLGIINLTNPDGNTTQYDIDSCYPETIQRIASSFPKLSKNESRYAMMFALGISADVIAEIQNVETESIRKTKQRIRKKIDLNRSVKVEEFFQDFVSI